MADRIDENFETQSESATKGFVLLDAGISDYDAVYATQLALVEKKKKEKLSYDYLVLVQHPDVYTFGRKSKESPPETLPNSFVIERGGEATFHNVGQLVGYPILTLGKHEQDVHLHLRRLESALIEVLGEYGIPCESRPKETGVWVCRENRKIASIGVAVAAWITYHGFALNVNNDLTGFSRIHPCGYAPDVMTSMARELGDHCPSLDEVKESFVRAFGKHFDRLLLV